MPRKIDKAVRGVYEREPGEWWIRYAYNGKEKRERAPSRGAAIELYRKRKEAVRLGEKLPENLKRVARVTFRQIGQAAIDWYTGRGMKDVRTFTGRMKIVMAALGDRIAEDIKPADLDRWISARCKTPATANRYRTTISKAYSLAAVPGLVTSNPAKLVEFRPEHNTRERYLTAEEEAKLRAAISRRCPEHLPAFIIALHTGMRQTEQFKLRWEHVYFDLRVLHLTKTKVGPARDVDMNDTCYRTLKQLAKNKRPHGRVFLSVKRKNQPINDSKKWFENAVAESGIPHFVWHDLRHTFCCRLAQKGATLQAIGKLAGHTSAQTTQRYAHLVSTQTADAVKLIG